MPTTTSEDESDPLMVHMGSSGVPTSSGEMKRSGHILLLCVADYVLLSGAHTHLPALLMLDITQSLGMSIFTYSLCIGIGCLIKSILVLFATGPLIQRYGARHCAIATTAVSGLLMALLGLAPSRVVFFVLLVLLETATAFAEQPNFICLLATHFDALASFATATIASAFSVAGVLLPLLLSPVLASSGWRAVLFRAAGGCVVLLPFLHLFLKPGTLAVGGSNAASHRDVGGGSTEDGTAFKPSAAIAAGEQGVSSGQRAPFSEAAGCGGTTSVAVGGGHSCAATEICGATVDVDGGPASDKRAAEGAAPLPVAVDSRPLAPHGTSASEAFRGAPFWALWAATFLHLLYGSLLSGHLTTALRMGAGCDVVTAASINAVQFSCAIGGKVASGVLLSLPSRRAVVLVRWLLFVIAPLVYTFSHLLLLDVHVHPAAAGLARGSGAPRIASLLTFATSKPRLLVYAVTGRVLPRHATVSPLRALSHAWPCLHSIRSHTTQVRSHAIDASCAQWASPSG